MLEPEGLLPLQTSIACFEKAIEIDPTSAIDYANIASNLRDKGDTEAAITMYRKALSLDPTIDFARESLKRLTEDVKAACPSRIGPDAEDK